MRSLKALAFAVIALPPALILAYLGWLVIGQPQPEGGGLESIQYYLVCYLIPLGSMFIVSLVGMKATDVELIPEPD